MNGTLSKNKKELHHSLKQIDEDQKLTSAVKAHEMEPSVETRHHNHQGGHEMEFNDRNRKNENPDYHHLTSYWLTPLGKKKTDKDQRKEKMLYTALHRRLQLKSPSTQRNGILTKKNQRIPRSNIVRQAKAKANYQL